MKKVFSVLVVLFISFQLNALWVQTNGPDGGYVSCLEVNGNNIFATSGTRAEYNGVYLSTNKGADRTKVNKDLPADIYIKSLAISGTNIFAGIIGYNEIGGVYLSTNNGTNWTLRNNGIIFYTDVMSLANWIQVNNGLPSKT